MTLLLVRHAEATGQDPDATLTPAGQLEADKISEFILKNYTVSRVFCSGFVRTSSTILPLSRMSGIHIVIDERLQEHYGLDDGGEESREEAMDRVLEAIDDIRSSSKGVDVLVSHGDLLSIALAALDPGHYASITADDLSRPDLYCLNDSTQPPVVKRIKY